jgi:hypothetical protein
MASRDWKSTLERLLASPAAKWGTIAVPLVIAWLQFVFKDAITSSWPFFRQWPGISQGKPVWSVILYWTLIPISATLIYCYGWAKDREAKRLRAIPDGQYLKEFSRRICDSEYRLAKMPRIAKADLAEMLSTLRSLLDGVAVLASNYDLRSKTRYAANVMYFVSRDDLPSYAPLLYAGTKKKLASLSGALFLSKEFSSAEHGDGDSDPFVTDIALPLPNQTSEGEKLHLLPGAQKVYLQKLSETPSDKRLGTDGADDVSKIELDGLDQDDRRNVKKFYSDSGAGRAIKSFMSFPLFSSEQEIIGVLNIQCNKTNWVGGEEERKDYCITLLMPLVNAIGNITDLVLQEIRRSITPASAKVGPSPAL